MNTANGTWNGNLNYIRAGGAWYRAIVWVMPPPETVYIRGPIKGCIYPSYNYYPTVTEWGQHPRL